MKFTILLLFVVCLHVCGQVSAQGITLKVKNSNLEDVFKEIKKQSGYSFLYNNKTLVNAKKVSIDVRNATLENVLILCFKEQPFTYEIVNKTIVLKEKEELPKKDVEVTPPTSIDIKGVVKNDKGEPVEGASVVVKETGKGIATNASGEFALTGIGPNATLIITALNIETREIKVNGNSDIAVIVKIKTTALAEVGVVAVANTGYQQVKPNETNGSLVVITNEMLNQQTGSNILQRLDGITSGLLFNIGKNGVSNGPVSTTNISIRGLSTINGPLDPLIVLDNFPYEGRIDNINPNDVESITILKDAAATSIYGARGGNGVIVITTKKGRFNQKLQIDFNSTMTVYEKPDLFYLPQMSSSDYIDVEQFLFNKGYFDTKIASTPYLVLTPAIEILLKKRNGTISASDADAQLNSLKQIDSRNDLLKYFYQTPLLQQYGLNLSGGSGNIAWTISGNFNKGLSNLGSNSTTTNLSTNNTYKPFKNLELSISVLYSNQEDIGGGKSIPSLYRNTPYIKYVDDNGNPIPIAVTYRDAFTDTVGNGKLLDWKYYPLENYKHLSSKNLSQEFVANIGLKWKVFKGLNVTVDYQTRQALSRSSQLSDIENYYTRNLINKFTNLNAPVNNPELRNPVPFGGILTTSQSSNVSQSIRNQLSFNQGWNKHSLTAIAGIEIRSNKSGPGTGSTIYGYIEEPLSQKIVDFKTKFRDFITGNVSSVIPGAPTISKLTEYRFVSVYANFAYTYLKRFYLSGSMRKDASNTFGLNTNDKWNPLWSAGIGWNISKEKFYKLKSINYLKIKATWGYSGNVDLSKTALPILMYGNNGTTGFPAANVSINNPDLRWEKSRQLNIGIEFKAKWLSGNIEYYAKKGTDLYGVTPIDYTTYGNNTTVKNVANMKGDGVDISFQTLNLNHTIEWTTTFLFSYNTNKTTKYFDQRAINGNALVSTSGNFITPSLGMPLYAIAAYRWGGLDASGNPQGYYNGVKSTNYSGILNDNLAKGLSSESVKYMGPTNPPFSGSLLNTFSFKGFAFSFNITYKFGYYFRKPIYTSNSVVTGGISFSDFSKRWQKPGDELITDVPAFIYPVNTNASNRDIFYQYAEINVLKADNIRLQFVNLSYTLTRKMFKMPFEDVGIYLNAANLGILWRANKEKIDPDYPSSIYPPKSLSVGLKFRF